MANSVQILIQSIKHNGKEIDLGHLVESVYIEKADAWGPVLILKYNDINSIIRDEYRIVEGDVLTVTIGDPLTDDELNLTEQFTVLSMPLNGPLLTINCVQSDIHALLAHAGSARIFRAKSGLYLCQQLLNKSGVKYSSSKNPIIEDYHLLPGTRPVNLIRRMARETGRLAWYARNEFTLKSFDELMADGDSSAIEYHWNDSRQAHQIANYDKLSSHWKKKDSADKNYIAFDFKEGIVSEGSGSGPTQWMGAAKKNTLSAMGDIPIPSILFLAAGYGQAQPGKVVKFTWNKSQSSQLLDESLPSKGLIYSVSHHQAGNLYQNKIMTIASGKS